jgi:hypothetical protein
MSDLDLPDDPTPFEAADASLPEPAAPTRWWRKRPIQILAAVAVIAIGAGAWIAANHSPQITVSGVIGIPIVGDDGTITVNALDSTGNPSPVAGDACTTVGGYTDIAQGTAVTIGAANGSTLAVGALGAGTVVGTQELDQACSFPFTVSAPGGQSEYTVTISHRGTQVFTPQQVAQGITLTLGD